MAAVLGALTGNRDCLVWDILFVSSWLFLALSLATIFILSWQSYVTLAYPYKTIITKHRLKIAVVLTWFLVLAALAKSTFLRDLYLAFYIAAALILLTMISVIITSVSTYRIVARHRRAIQATQTPAIRKIAKKLRILRSTITRLLVTISLFVCYIFGLLLSFYIIISTYKIEHKTLLFLYTCSATLMYMNSLVNPCLLFWRSSVLRQTARGIFNGNRCNRKGKEK